ncbi:MAG: hypothetical protein MEQ07_12415, partial [Aquimonas sp.]|nr:hypothetical protein [Aquimonas sp.]
MVEAIISCNEWEHHAQSIASKDWMAGREPLRHFFDAYEAFAGEDWLGVMEWAVIEEVRLRGSDLTADRPCIDRILARMANHPDI